METWKEGKNDRNNVTCNSFKTSLQKDKITAYRLKVAKNFDNNKFPDKLAAIYSQYTTRPPLRLTGRHPNA